MQNVGQGELLGQLLLVTVRDSIIWVPVGVEGETCIVAMEPIPVSMFGYSSSTPYGSTLLTVVELGQTIAGACAWYI